MATRGTKMCTLLALCLVSTMSLYMRVQGQPGCTSALMGLAPCLSYITGGAGAPTPGSTCCTQLQSVVKTQANCLCQVLNGSGANSFGVSINQTQAMQLPGACKVVTPPVSQCKASSGNPAAVSPVGSPMSSPSDAASPEAVSVTPGSSTTPTVSTSVPPKGSSNGSKSTKGSTSAGNMNKFSMHFTLFVLFLTSTKYF